MFLHTRFRISPTSSFLKKSRHSSNLLAVGSPYRNGWNFENDCNFATSTLSKSNAEENHNNSSRKIQDYTKYISRKSSLREPTIMGKLAKKAAQSGRKFIIMAEGMPCESIFPFEEMTVKLKNGKTLDINNKDMNMALQYIPYRGLPQFISIVRDFQEKVHKPINWEDKEIIITSGSQDGIYKTIELLVNEGDSLLVPNPIYSGVDVVTMPYKLKLLGVEQDNYGMTPKSIRDSIEKCRKRGISLPRVIYLNPTGNNPTGTMIPNARRQEIYEIACEYDLMILEDDPYHFISFGGEEPKSLLSSDVEGRVIRFDSFSKVLSSGLRVGWITAPKAFCDKLELHMHASYFSCSAMSQMLALKLMESNGFDGMMAHFNNAKNIYIQKRDRIIGYLEKHLSGLVEWNVPEAGIFIWIKVKGVPDIYNLIARRAFADGLVLSPGHAFTIGTVGPCPYIRVSYARASPEDMEEACIKLAKLIKEEQKAYTGFTPIQ